MTKKTDALAQKIAQEQAKLAPAPSASKQNGYQTALDMLTNLIGCVLIGVSLGVLFQNLFHTSVLLTAGLTIFGGIAGLWSVVRYAIQR